MASTSKVDSECRIFQERWTEQYFFINNNNNPLCLICNETVSVLKEYNLKRHYNSKHQKYDRFEGQLGKDKINNLKKSLGSPQMLFRKYSSEVDE
jgi:hypothetical protein